MEESWRKQMRQFQNIVGIRYNRQCQEYLAQDEFGIDNVIFTIPVTVEDGMHRSLQVGERRLKLSAEFNKVLHKVASFLDTLDRRVLIKFIVMTSKELKVTGYTLIERRADRCGVDGCDCTVSVEALARDMI